MNFAILFDFVSFKSFMLYTTAFFIYVGLVPSIYIPHKISYVANFCYHFLNLIFSLFFPCWVNCFSCRGIFCTVFHLYNALLLHRGADRRNMLEEDGRIGWEELKSFSRKRNGNSGIVFYVFIFNLVSFVHLDYVTWELGSAAKLMLQRRQWWLVWVGLIYLVL